MRMMKKERIGICFPRSVFVLLLLAFAQFCCSCSAKTEQMPLVCQRIVFFVSEDEVKTDVFFSTGENSDRHSISYSAKTGEELMQKLLHAETRTLYKATETVVFVNSLLPYQKQELLTAIFDRPEFGLSCTAIEAEDPADALTEATLRMSLSEYFREQMNRNEIIQTNGRADR